MQPRYNRTLDELRQVASMFWSNDLASREAELSIIPLLLKTQDQFISILSVEVEGIEGLFQIVDAASLSANLFVKHAMVLADFGGESFKRLSNEFERLFPEGKMNYVWNGEQRSYEFKYLGQRILSSQTLKVDGKGLLSEQRLSDMYRDAIAILVLGNASYSATNDNFLAKCQLSDYMGRSEELDVFVRQRYIWVSRITAGAQSNSLGHLAQDYVVKYLKSNLSNVLIVKDGNIPGITHTDGKTETTFDIVVSRSGKYVAVEVSFQVTTNSVIERKAGQAKSRFEQITAKGHKIAYVLDGAGNFERRSAASTLCTYSHCTVAFSNVELALLCQFIEISLSD